jgi:hypothetical protein
MSRLDRTIGNQTFIFLVTGFDTFGKESSLISSDVCSEIFEEFKKIHPDLEITSFYSKGILYDLKNGEYLMIILINHRCKPEKTLQNRV